MKLFDFGNPWFRPLPRRLAVTGICAMWTVFELIMGSTWWLATAAILTALSGWFLIYAYPPKE